MIFKRPLKRLVTVQGPLQLLTALAVLIHERAKQKERLYMDYLVIHGLCVRPPTEKWILEAILDIAKSWTWAQVIYLDEFERRLNTGFYQTLHSAINDLRATIGIHEADIILAARNWQFTNDLLLKAYHNAYKITYGDGLGHVDSYASNRYVQFDEACLTMPIRAFSPSHEPIISFSSLPITIIPKQYYLNVIDRYLTASVHASSFCDQFTHEAGNTLLILTENATEAGLTNLDTEIQIYLDVILKTIQHEKSVLLKPHPRETFNQCAILSNILQSNFQINAQVISSDKFFRALPIEIISYKVRFKKIIVPLPSNACLSLKFLFDIDCLVPFEKQIIAKINPNFQDEWLNYFQMSKLIIDRIKYWDGRSLLYTTERQR